MRLSFHSITFLLIVIIILLQMVVCSTPEYAGGVETTNGLTIAVKKNEIRGTAPAGSEIVLCDTSYVSPPFFQPMTKMYIDTTFADENGVFWFDSLVDGFYNLTGRNYNLDSGTIIRTIAVNHLHTKEIIRKSDYTPLGSITGTVFLDSIGTHSAMVSITGTGMSCTTDSRGIYIIEKIPAGIFKIVGSFQQSPKEPGIDDYFSVSVENITINENVPAMTVDLHLERIY